MLSEVPWLQYLIAFLVVCHGFVYLRVMLNAPNQLQGWNASSWISGGALSGDRLKVLLLALDVAAGVLIVAAGIAMGLAASFPGWWRPLAIVGAALGLASFAFFLDGQPQLVVQEGGIGAGVSAILLVGAIAFAGAFS